MHRREFLQLAVASTAAAIPTFGKTERDDFRWLEATIPEMQRAMMEGKTSATGLTKAYLKRIEKIDRRGPKINSVIEVNPEAIEIARKLDQERKRGELRGSMHGIPVLLKDNIDTGDQMLTTAGSLALMGSKASRDAFLVRKLREAGAVILGKTNLSEWANIRSNQSTSGWSARGGLTANPYALDRNTSGSSSGSGAAVAANLCAVAVGTETNGSVISPSTCCGIVGIKPTVGLISRSGIIPISETQDTAGPMTRTVTDAAILLEAMMGVDPADRATESSEGRTERNYTQFLDPDGLRGARIGVARQYFNIRFKSITKILDDAIQALTENGAEVINLPIISSFDQFGEAEYNLLLYEFKDGLQRYLATRGSDCKVKSLADVIEFNDRNKEKELCYFGQDIFHLAEKKGPLSETAYREALEKCRRLSRTEGIDAVMNEHRLDAIVAPSGGPAHRTDLFYGDRDIGGSSSPAAVAGYPSITVPAGMASGLPVGISFFGRAYSEPALLRIAYAFEQVTHARRIPTYLNSIEGDAE